MQNGGDGVVRGIAGVGDDIYAGIAVITPGAQDIVRGTLHFLGTAAHQAHGGNRPVDDTGFHAGVARVAQRYGDMRFLHGEDIAPALEMAVAQDAAAYNRQVSVGTAGVMGELCHKVKNFSQGMAVHLHGLVAVVQHDAVLMKIGIGAVLQIERFTGQVYGHNAMGLAGREVDAPRIADILLAQHALGVAGSGLQPLHGNHFGVFFRFGQVDGNFQLTVRGGRVPLDVLGNLRRADVVGHNAQIIEPVRGSFGAALGIQFAELAADFAFARHQGTHHAGFKVDAVLRHTAVKQALGGGKLHHLVQQGSGGVKILFGHLFLTGLGQTQQIQQGVAGYNGIQLLDELVFAAKAQQALHIQGKCGITLFGSHCGNVHGFDVLFRHLYIPPTFTIPHFTLTFHGAKSHAFAVFNQKG